MKKDVFSLIDSLNVKAVREYLKEGGSIQVKSHNGFPLLPYVVLKFLKDTPQTYGGPAQDISLEHLSPIQQKLYEIGTALIEFGCSYEDRLGKTKVSIKISDRLKPAYPEMHREWASLHMRNKMFAQEDVGGAMETHQKRQPRKI